RDYLQNVCNEYHTCISWRLSDHEEPEVPLPVYDPLAPPTFEQLSDEEADAKHKRVNDLNKRIRRWLKYRARSLRRGFATKASLHDNPFSVLLAKLSGLTAPPKARQGFQQYMHESYDADISSLVAERWAKASINPDGSANTKSPDAPFRCAIARELFKTLPEEQQQAIRDRAVEEAKERKRLYAKGMKDGPSKSPEARQKCIDKLGRFVAPIIKGLQEYTGLQGFLVMGGPIPRYGGELGTIHLSVGSNLATVPTPFPSWDKGRWARDVVGFFKDYLATAYTTQQCSEAALPGPAPVTGLYKFDDDSDKGDYSDSDDTSSSSSSSSDSESDTDTGSDGEKKKKKKQKKKEARKEKKKIEAQKKKDGKAGEKRKHLDTETGGSAAKKAKTSGAAGTEAAAAKAAAKAAAEALEIRRAGDRERQSNIERNKRILEELNLKQAASLEAMGIKSRKPAASKNTNVKRVATASGPRRRSTQVPGAGAVTRAGAIDDAPAWMLHAFGELTREPIGQLFETLVTAWVELERSYAFAFGTAALKATHRPAEVKKWIGDARGKTLAVVPITNMGKFVESWWKWWTVLQPSWRGSARGQREGPPAVAPDADWSQLVVPGQNGLLTVMTTLYWWGCAEKGTGMAERSQGWEEAARDVLSVLNGLRHRSK
ncbi:hypothetical protein DFH06DRAFT_1020601, partial [Mycena polygramma]